MPFRAGARKTVILRRPALVAVAGLDASTTQWVNDVIAAGGTVSAGRQTVVDTLIKYLKSNNVFTMIDRLFLLGAENTQSAGIDVVNRGTLTVHGSPNFTANLGYTAVTPNTDFLDLNYIPSGGGKMATGAAFMGYYGLTSRTTGAFVNIGALSAGNQNYLINFNTGAVIQADLTSAGNASIARGSNDANGNWMIRREPGNTSIEAIHNEMSLGQIGSGVAATGLPTVSMYGLAYNNAGSPNLGTTDQVFALVFGGGTNTTADMTNIQHAINAYATSLSVNVYV